MPSYNEEKECQLPSLSSQFGESPTPEVSDEYRGNKEYVLVRIELVRAAQRVDW